MRQRMPISTENHRRSPRFMGREKMDLAFHSPKKKSRVQPIKTFLPATSKELPPSIPMSQLQKIGVEKCGMLPKEVVKVDMPGFMDIVQYLWTITFRGSIKQLN
uniref:Uncharacterized protein n=1 Tax=Oryza punctata TaxID=4537 RepID=A0A0E0LJF5_ORYPU